LSINPQLGSGGCGTNSRKLNPAAGAAPTRAHHIMVDTQGWLLNVVITAANVSNNHGFRALFEHKDLQSVEDCRREIVITPHA